jgi:type IV pilus assembly protein PilA
VLAPSTFTNDRGRGSLVAITQAVFGTSLNGDTPQMVRNRKGFTLIELLIVVVIIGILAAIAIPKFANTKGKAYVTAMKSDLKQLMLAEEGFFTDSSRYADLAGLGSKFAKSTAVNDPTITTGAGFWYATITHSQLTGTTCGIAVNTTNPTVAGAGDGEPACK